MSAVNSHAPEIIGTYVIEAALAHGSMGTVYVARHSLTYARVALKVMRSETNVDKQAEERFLREVRAAAQIGHEGIVKVQDAGKTSEGHLYLAMELLTGETLEDRIARGTGERLTGMDWLAAMLEPLMAAHAHSIVHRDLKPANVFIARQPDATEQIKLLDFGLARDMREKSGTQTGIALGTPYYMSPEQAARPKDVSPASDVWSVGVMMYEILTGHMPFDGETMHAVVIGAATLPHVPCAERAPNLDPELAQLVDQCLSKDPLARPHHAGALRERLLPLLDDPTVRAELANSVAREPEATGEPLDQDGAGPLRMPFADTAIALAHDSRIQDVYPRAKRSGLGVWVSTLAALALMIGGFFWALERNAEKNASHPRVAIELDPMPPDPRPSENVRERSNSAATLPPRAAAPHEAAGLHEPAAESPRAIAEVHTSAADSRRARAGRRTGTSTSTGLAQPLTLGFESGEAPAAPSSEAPAAAALIDAAPAPIEMAPAPVETPEPPAAPSGETPPPAQAESAPEAAPSEPPAAPAPEAAPPEPQAATPAPQADIPAPQTAAPAPETAPQASPPAPESAPETQATQ